MQGGGDEPNKRPPNSMTDDIDVFAEFVTEAQRRVRAVASDEDYRLAYIWVTGAPEWKSLPDLAVDDLSHMLEAKRREVVGRSMVGGLAG